jgi:hypothetical protein
MRWVQRRPLDIFEPQISGPPHWRQIIAFMIAVAPVATFPLW